MSHVEEVCEKKEQKECGKKKLGRKSRINDGSVGGLWEEIERRERELLRRMRSIIGDYETFEEGSECRKKRSSRRRSMRIDYGIYDDCEKKEEVMIER